MSLSSVKRNLRLFAQLQLECIITSERKHTLQTEIEKFSLLDEQYSAKTSYMNTMLKKCTWWGLHALFPMRLFFNYKKIISSLRLWIITASVFCILNSLKNLFSTPLLCVSDSIDWLKSKSSSLSFQHFLCNLNIDSLICYKYISKNVDLNMK